MAVMVVPCPGCQSTLKAPENMAGKKAKCKKCGVSFRIPGGDAPTGDTAGDSQMLSAMDLPIPESAADPFDFAAPTPQPVAKKSVAIPKPEPKAPAPLLPKPAAKLPPPKPPALKLKDDEAPAEPLSLGDDDEIPAVAPGSGNPFGFSDAAAEGDGFAFDNSRPAPAKRKSKTKLMSDEEEGEPLVEKEPKPARGYNSKDAGGKSSTGKLILIVGVFGLVVGSVIAGTMIYLNSKKGTEQVGAEKKDEKKETPVPTSDPIPTPAKDDKKGGEVPPPKGGEKTAPKKDPGGKKPQTPVAGAMLKLGPSPTIQFAAMAANRMNVQEPSIRLAILPNLPGKVDSAFTLSRKVL